jgi:putative ABC transport system permease protein
MFWLSFLGEAAGIGFLGGLGGVVISWALGQILNVIVLSYMAGQAVQTGGLPPTSAVVTPLVAAAVGAGFRHPHGLCCPASIPALSAATLAPVTALKYE